MLGPVVHLHGDTDETVSWLATVPVVRVLLHRAADSLLHMGDGGLLEMLSLFPGAPVFGIGGVSAERAEDLFVAHFVAPVFLVNLEFELALGRWAFSVKIAVRVGRDGHRDFVAPFKASQFSH